MNNFYYFSVAAMVVFSSFVFGHKAVAQTDELAGMTVIARVNIQDCSMQQSGRELTLTCNFINDGKPEKDVRYSVELISGEGLSRKILDRKVFEDTLTLDGGAVLKKVIKYTVPDYIGGTSAVWVKARNSEGVPLALNYIGLTSHTAQGDAVLIDSSTCTLSVLGEKSNKKYTIEQGVDILPTEGLQATCTVTNLGTNVVTLQPTFIGYKRSVYGDIISLPNIKNPDITLKPKEVARYTFSVPHTEVPQSYDTVLTFRREEVPVSNPLAIHYVIQGVSATIQTLTMDKSNYVVGDTALIETNWSASADSFPESRSGGTASAIATISFMMKSGSVLCGELSQPAPVVESLQNFSIPIVQDCENPQLTMKLLRSDGMILTEKTIGEIDTQPVTETRESVAWVFWGAIGGGMLLLLGLGTLLYKRRKPEVDSSSSTWLPPTNLLLLLACAALGSFAASPDSVCADTFLGPTGTYVAANLNKSVYSPGEAMYASSEVLWTTCANGAYTVYGPGGTNIPTGEEHRLFDDYFNPISTTFTAPTTSGAHIFNFGMWQFEGARSGQAAGVPLGGLVPYHDYDYTVISEPGAPGNPYLVATPPTINSGDSSTLTYDCTGNYPYIDNGVLVPGEGPGSIVVTPADTTTYTLLCFTETGGVADVRQATVTVIPGAAVSGVCDDGSTNWVNVCAQGSLRDIPDDASNSLWECTGSNGGATASCARPNGFIHGLCGSAHGTNTTTAPTSNQCNFGTLNWTDNSGSDGSFNWECVGLGGGTTQSCAASTALAAPTNLSATPQACGTNNLHLQWDAVSGATSYSVYYASGVWVANTLGPDYTFTGDTNQAYSFVVRANNASGIQSADSSAVTETTPHSCTPPSVTLEASVNGAPYSTSDQTINQSDTVVLRWLGTNATSCTGSGNGFSVSATNGSDAVTTPAPNSTIEFSVTCQNSNGNSQDTLTVTSRQLPNLTQPAVYTPVMGSFNQGAGAYNGMTLTFRTENNGGSTIPADSDYRFRLDLNNDGTFEVDETRVNALPAGLSVGSGTNESEATSLEIPVGVHRVHITVDSSNPDKVDETNEGDNFYNDTITIPAANPGLTMTVSPERVQNGQNAMVTWAAATPYSMNCSVFGPGMATRTFDLLTAVAGDNNISVGPLTAKSEYTIRCDAAGTIYTATDTVETQGVIEEI